MNLRTEDALLSGIPIGAGRLAHCDVCGVCLRPEHRVELLVVIDGTQIDVAVTRCGTCARGSIRPETRRPCLLARGRLLEVCEASGRSHLILSGASVIDRTDT